MVHGNLVRIFSANIWRYSKRYHEWNTLPKCLCWCAVVFVRSKKPFVGLQVWIKSRLIAVHIYKSFHTHFFLIVTWQELYMPLHMYEIAISVTDTVNLFYDLY